jgi:hypothetical protein
MSERLYILMSSIDNQGTIFYMKRERNHDIYRYIYNKYIGKILNEEANTMFPSK